jgi:hypothetical protein
MAPFLVVMACGEESGRLGATRADQSVERWGSCAPSGCPGGTPCPAASGRAWLMARDWRGSVAVSQSPFELLLELISRSSRGRAHSAAGGRLQHFRRDGWVFQQPLNSVPNQVVLQLEALV